MWLFLHQFQIGSVYNILIDYWSSVKGIWNYLKTPLNFDEWFLYRPISLFCIIFSWLLCSWPKSVLSWIMCCAIIVKFAFKIEWFHCLLTILSTATLSYQIIHRSMVHTRPLTVTSDCGTIDVLHHLHRRYTDLHQYSQTVSHVTFILNLLKTDENWSNKQSVGRSWVKVLNYEREENQLSISLRSLIDYMKLRINWNWYWESELLNVSFDWEIFLQICFYHDQMIMAMMMMKLYLWNCFSDAEASFSAQFHKGTLKRVAGNE